MTKEVQASNTMDDMLFNICNHLLTSPNEEVRMMGKEFLEKIRREQLVQGSIKEVYSECNFTAKAA